MNSEVEMWKSEILDGGLWKGKTHSSEQARLQF